MAPVQQSAAAPALHPQAQAQVQAQDQTQAIHTQAIHVVPPVAGDAPAAKAASAAASITYQPSLFRDPSLSPKVVPIPTMTPLHPVRGEPGSRRAAVPAPRLRRRAPAGQGQLDLVEQAIAPSDEKILCDVPVADPLERAAAACCDAGIVLAGAVIVIGMFFAFAEGLALTRPNLILMGGAAGCVAILYRAVLCLGDGNTPGMRLKGLRLVDFDGRRPHRNKRIIRQAAGVLSFVAAGAGLLWALVDEEKLTWHDHISKTFPTHS